LPNEWIRAHSPVMSCETGNGADPLVLRFASAARAIAQSTLPAP
jgi:hypothetical protein